MRYKDRNFNPRILGKCFYFVWSVVIGFRQITNFPFLSSNIPSLPVYGVFTSQLIRYTRDSSSYECFNLRAVRLSNKFHGRGYVKERLRSSPREFCGRYGDLIKKHEVPRILHDILYDDHLQRHPPLIRHYANFSPITDLDLVTEFDLIARGIHRTFATDVAENNKERLLLRTPGPVPLWDLQVF